MMTVRVGFGLAVGLASALAWGGDSPVRFASCEKCPYRMRISADGRSATVNEARLRDGNPSESALAQRKSAMAERARMLMRTAEATRQRGAVRRPMMGWSSWNTFGVFISEDIILSVARAMATNGLLAAGYDYVNIDDGFFGGRDAQGHLKFHPQRFPKGLKGTVDGIHALGFKAGTYSDAGIATCGSMWNDDAKGRGSGLYGHDADDLKLHFNTLGFDFIKVDYCGAKDQKLDERKRYGEIAAALRATGRTDARLNLCRWAFPGTWAADIADSWRTTRDIRANWPSVRDIVGENLFLSAYAGPGHYNDLDMLEVGLPKGAAKTPFKDDTGLSPEEELTHFGLWCIMSSPLLLGCDVRTMPASTLALVTNPFLLAMNQNDLGLAAAPVVRDGGAYVLAKDADAKFAAARYVALYNPTEAPHAFRAAFRDLELDGSVAVFDLVERVDMGERTDTLEMTVPAHATRFLRLDAERRIERVRYGAEASYLAEYQEVHDPIKAGTAFYQTNALATCGFVVRNLGGRKSNDLVWPEVRILEAGPRTLTFRVAARQDGAFLVQVDDAVPMRVAVKGTAGAFSDVVAEVRLSAGIHRVRISGDDALPMPDIDGMRVEKVEEVEKVKVKKRIPVLHS